MADPGLVARVREARHRVVTDHGAPAPPSRGLQPGRGAVAVAEADRGPTATGARGQLVHVVQQRARLHQRRRPRRSPRAAARRASHAATSATAHAWRRNQSGGSSERSRRAASGREGIVIGRIVAGGGRAGDGHRHAAVRLGPLVRTLTPSRAQVDLDRAVPVRPVDPGPGVAAGARAWPAPGGRSRCPAPTEISATVGRVAASSAARGRRRAAVVGDLEDVELRQAAGEQRRVHVVLGITGEQEPAPVRLAEEDDRRVVDAAPDAGGFERHGAGFRPQDGEAGSRRAG